MAKAFAPSLKSVLTNKDDAGKIGLLGFLIAAVEGSADENRSAKEALGEAEPIEGIKEAAASATPAIAQRAASLLAAVTPQAN